MKLELKHILPYLLHKVKVRQEWVDGSHHDYIMGVCVIENLAIDQDKLILRPLSDLTKEIEVNGEKFIPYDKLKTIVSEDQWVRICETINKPNYTKICDMPHWWVNLLYAWHFDVGGLIEKELAINMNKL